MGVDLEVYSENGLWIITFFGLKSGQDLKNRAAHPNQEFQGGPPGWTHFDALDLYNYHSSKARDYNDILLYHIETETFLLSHSCLQ